VYHRAVRLVLASQSPRRADLLTAAGFSFLVRPVDVDESVLPGESPDAYVLRLALEKARAACRDPGDVCLGADTTVVLDGRLLGKPADASQATEMLRFLSGRTHEVLTGVALVADRAQAYDVAVTQVTFLHMTDEEIAWYVATGEPEDKAGAYAIQGFASRFVDSIAGSYSNVVGLPVSLVYRLVREVAGTVLS
jgi:septum formation protein